MNQEKVLMFLKLNSFLKKKFSKRFLPLINYKNIYNICQINNRIVIELKNDQYNITFLFSIQYIIIITNSHYWTSRCGKTQLVKEICKSLLNNKILIVSLNDENIEIFKNIPNVMIINNLKQLDINSLITKYKHIVFDDFDDYEKEDCEILILKLIREKIGITFVCQNVKIIPKRIKYYFNFIFCYRDIGYKMEVWENFFPVLDSFVSILEHLDYYSFLVQDCSSVTLYKWNNKTNSSENRIEKIIDSLELNINQLKSIDFPGK